MYNYEEIKNKVGKIVKDACYSKSNDFTYTVWDYHILPVVKHSLMLGGQLGADPEVLELAALLHDIASVSNSEFYNDHHIKGAEMAGDILAPFGLPEEKIEAIKHCIVSHRSSTKLERKTIEAEILASADAMSHITELADMFYLTFGVHKYETAAGADWLKNKLERSWNKIMPEGRQLIEKDYAIAREILEKATGRM